LIPYDLQELEDHNKVRYLNGLDLGYSDIV